MLFESTRITLRKMTVQDIEVYHKWRNDLEVMQSTAPMLDVYHIEESRRICDKSHIRISLFKVLYYS
jgi:RimJ/RimL family protein N-acetyltransferase